MHAQTEQTGLGHAASSLVMHGQGGSGKRWWMSLAAVLGTFTSSHWPRLPAAARMTGTERVGCNTWQDCEAQAGLKRNQQGEDGTRCRSGYGVHHGPLGLTQSPSERAVFLHDYQMGAPKKTLRKKYHGVFFPLSFCFPLTVLMNVF